MLAGCAVGGIVEGIGGGVKTDTFAFTSLLTIPVFDPMVLRRMACRPLNLDRKREEECA